MKKILVMVTIAALFIVTAEKAPWAKYFTDPSIPLEQSDWEGKKKSKVPEEEYQRNQEPEEEQKEEINREQEKKKEKKQYRKEKSTPSASGRKGFQFGLKAGYNVIPKTEAKFEGSSSYTELWDSGSRYSFDLNMEFLVNVLNGHIGIGAGIGSTIDYWSDNETETIVFVPVYALVKGYLFKGTTPFVSLGLGYNAYTYFETSSSELEVTGSEGGLHFSVGGGFITKNGLQVEIVYVMTEGGVKLDYLGYPTSIKTKHSHLTLAIAKFF